MELILILIGILLLVVFSGNSPKYKDDAEEKLKRTPYRPSRKINLNKPTQEKKKNIKSESTNDIYELKIKNEKEKNINLDWKYELDELVEEFEYCKSKESFADVFNLLDELRERVKDFKSKKIIQIQINSLKNSEKYKKNYVPIIDSNLIKRSKYKKARKSRKTINKIKKDLETQKYKNERFNNYISKVSDTDIDKLHKSAGDNNRNNLDQNSFVEVECNLCKTKMKTLEEYAKDEIYCAGCLKLKPEQIEKIKKDQNIISSSDINEKINFIKFEEIKADGSKITGYKLKDEFENQTQLNKIEFDSKDDSNKDTMVHKRLNKIRKLR